MKLCVAKTRFRIFEIKVVLALLADLANLCVKEPERVCVNCVKDPDRVCVKDPDLDCKNKSPSKAIVSLEPFRGNSWSHEDVFDKFESRLFL